MKWMMIVESGCHWQESISWIKVPSLYFVRKGRESVDNAALTAEESAVADDGTPVKETNKGNLEGLTDGMADEEEEDEEELEVGGGCRICSRTVEKIELQLRFESIVNGVQHANQCRRYLEEAARTLQAFRNREIRAY
jgi:hypothetical protein